MMPITSSRTALRAAVTLLGLTALVIAGPASADVPEGWSNPEHVTWFEMLLITVLIPTAMFLVTALIFGLPALAKRRRKDASTELETTR